MAHPFLIAAGVALAIGPVIASAIHLFPPLWNAWQQFAFNMIPNNLPMMADLVEMRYRKKMSNGEYTETARKLGIAPELSERMYEAGQQMLSAGDYVTLWRRGEMDEGELKEKLESLRFAPDDIHNAQLATVFYPGPQDLVRFAVREVFTPALAQKYGIFDDFPPEFGVEAEKVGVSERVAHWYWGAHWELPSAQAGYEMLHRGVIGAETLRELLRARDVMPYWREKLMDISYRPLTRVDVRRMYRLGVLDEDAVTKAYRDLGYDDDNAKLMTDFTVRYESDEMAGVTRANIMSSYVKGIIESEDFDRYLAALGYPTEIVNFYRDQADFERAENTLDELSDELIARYNVGLLSLDNLQQILNDSNLPLTYINKVLQKVKQAQSQRTKLPTRSDLSGWYEKKIISDVQFYNYMKQLGYREDFIEYYIAEIRDDEDKPVVKKMSVSTYKRWYANKIIDKSQFLAALRKLNVAPVDIENILAEMEATSELDQGNA